MYDVAFTGRSRSRISWSYISCCLLLIHWSLTVPSLVCAARSPARYATTSTTINPILRDRPYKGRLIGRFRSLKKDDTPVDGPSSVVAGAVYAVDDKLLFLDQFTFSGDLEGMYLFGISSKPRSRRNDEFIIPTGQTCISTCGSLPAIWEENVLLALPRNISLSSLTELAIGTRTRDVIHPELREKYASIVIPVGFRPPHPYVLASRLGHVITTAGTSSGPIIVQDSRRILVERVKFDGTGFNAYFWVDRSPVPTPNGLRVTPNHDEGSPLTLPKLPKDNDTRYDALLDMRKTYRPVTGVVQSITVFDLKSVSIYDRHYRTVYGDAPFNGSALKGLIPPALDDLTIHRISEDAAILIRELNYDIGVCPDKDVLVQSSNPFPRLALPSARIPLTFTPEVMYGDEPAQQSPAESSDLPDFPPVNERRLLRNFWNCEKLDDVLEIQWKADVDFVTITLSAPVSALPDQDSSYIAFGVSGSTTKSEMIGSDVTMGYFTSAGFFLDDLIMGGKQQCDKSSPTLDAVCPRSFLGGKQVSKLFGGASLDNGKMSFSYRRPILNREFLGENIPLDRPVFVVWAIGPIDQASQLPLLHSAHARDSIPLDFGRTPENNCMAPQSITAPSVLNATDSSTTGNNETSTSP